MKYAYSLDGETYHGKYDTPEQAAIAGFDADTDQDYTEIEVGEVRIPLAKNFVPTYMLIEAIQDNAGSELGECAEDWLDKMPREKHQELAKLIGDWLEAYEPITFFGIDTDTIREFSREEMEDEL